MLRLAQPSDAKAMLDIYAPFIRDTSITFETEVPTIEEFGQRISNYLITCPWIVDIRDDKVAGYAYASKYRERSAYQWGVECSVYIHPDYTRQGIATTLYSALFRLLRLQGFTTVYAVINLPNDNSVALHESMGFRHFATYEKVGYKLGKWKNVGWWQLQLNDYIDNPAPVRKFMELDPGSVGALLNNS